MIELSTNQITNKVGHSSKKVGVECGKSYLRTKCDFVTGVPRPKFLYFPENRPTCQPACRVRLLAALLTQIPAHLSSRSRSTMGGCLSQPANIQAPASVEIVFDRKVEDDYDIGPKLGEGVQVRARILAPDNAMEPESDSDVHPSNLVRPVLTLSLIHI